MGACFSSKKKADDAVEVATTKITVRSRNPVIMTLDAVYNGSDQDVEKVSVEIESMTPYNDIHKKDLARLVKYANDKPEVTDEALQNISFLGGSCGETAWRDQLLQKLGQGRNAALWFNPQIDGWTAQWADEVEKPAKRKSQVMFFAIMGDTTSYASMVEVVHELRNGDPRKVIMVAVEPTLSVDLQLTPEAHAEAQAGRDYFISLLRKSTCSRLYIFDHYMDAAKKAFALNCKQQRVR
jgi:Nucleoside 2-deoxyribosyltransferase like